jgi:hypothetical protein
MAALICPRCKTQNLPDSAFCRSCGTSLAPGVKPVGAQKASARPKVAIRVVRADGGPELVVPMGRDELSCGRRGEIALEEDPFVAQTQARFFFSAGRLAVEDVGGGNGVFLRLRKERELPIAGELRLGRQRLILEQLPAPSRGPGGATPWGSADLGYRFRLLQMLEGGIRGAAFLLKEGDNPVGRDSGEITFPADGFVSGRHANLVVRQDHVFIRDVGSSNGTFIRLGGPTFVENGDHLLIGRELLRVEMT